MFIKYCFSIANYEIVHGEEKAKNYAANNVKKSGPDYTATSPRDNVNTDWRTQERLNAQREAGAGKSGTSSVKTDFYVKPNGGIVPATGYRYMPAEASYMESLKNTMEIPANPSGTYITFDKFDVPTPGRLQVPHDASICGSFDTLQIIDDIRVPNGKWGQASWLEPITKVFPKYGPGGATQALTYQKIKLNSLKDLSR